MVLSWKLSTCIKPLVSVSLCHMRLLLLHLEMKNSSVVDVETITLFATWFQIKKMPNETSLFICINCGEVQTLHIESVTSHDRCINF
jgi:hypothetical protein